MVDQAGSTRTPGWAVTAESASLRLDVFVRRMLPHLSRRALDQALCEKLFLINGRTGKKGDRLAPGDFIIFSGPAEWLADRPASAPRSDVGIIYEDNSLVALDKPAGMATHGFSARDDATLANVIVARWPQLLTVGKSRWEPGLVHRLDIETSGLILVAKTQSAFDILLRQFRRREVTKTYWALVWGESLDCGEIRLPLAHDSSDKRKMCVFDPEKNGKPTRNWPALTQYRRIGAAPGVSLLEVMMATGVTHQIRVHLAASGWPIVGDSLYGLERKEKLPLGRHFLHAKALQFHHPENRRTIKLEAALPAKLTDMLERFGIRF